MIDIWRKETSYRKIFTYHDNNQSIHSRIDRFYINKTQKIQNISITSNNLSDHTYFTNKKIKYLRKWILEVKYIHSKRKNLPTKILFLLERLANKKNPNKSLNQWWESCKILFKTLAIKFCITKNREINIKLKNLTNNIIQENKRQI